MEKDPQVKKIFLDTNILISAIFFRGNEAKLLTLPGLIFITSDTVVAELKTVILKKISSLKIESQKIALQEIENSLRDFSIVKESEYNQHLPKAYQFLKNDPDRKILAAVLASRPDYFITGDKHFHTAKIKKLVNVRYTKEILSFFGVIKKK